MRRRQILIFISALLMATLACGMRVFETLHVYSSTSTTLNEVYNESTGQILVDDVWVFRSDGTFEAVVVIGDDWLSFSGTYEGDNAGDIFYHFLDLDNDGSYDDEVIVDIVNDSFSYIDWEKDGEVYRYWLVEN